MLKFWVLVFNYKSPNQCVFAVFMALFVILLNFIGENFHSTSYPAGYEF